MPQGTWLGSLCFLILIDDLQVSCPVLKYVDDTTLTEVLSKGDLSSCMQDFLNELTEWSHSNNMLVNHSKTKEMIFGRLSNNPPPSLFIHSDCIQRVTSFKLLGVHITDNLHWDCHVDAICSKAASRLYFLKQLKRSGLSPRDLLYFYTTTTRPILEYACSVWHHGLTKAQSDKIEAIQRRALRIIYGLAYEIPYVFALSYAGLTSLRLRREEQGRAFFHQLCQPENCLHHLLPSPRNPDVTARLRHASKYPIIRTRTKRYQSFIQFALANYQ